MPPQTTNGPGYDRVTTTTETKASMPWLEAMGAVVAVVVMAVYAFTVVAPYFLRPAVSGPIIEIIKSNKSTVDLITTAVVMFYFGASVGRRKDQDAVGTLIQTNAAQTAALVPPSAGDAIPIAVGETKTIIGEEHKS